MCQRHMLSITPHKRSAVWGCDRTQRLSVSERCALNANELMKKARPVGTQDLGGDIAVTPHCACGLVRGY